MRGLTEIACAASLAGALLGCGAARVSVAEPEPEAREPNRPRGPEQALVEIWFEARELSSPFERGGHLNGPVEETQRHAHRTDAAAQELLDQVGVVVGSIDAPRCSWSIERIRAYEMPEPEAPVRPRAPELYGVYYIERTRAALVTELTVEVLAGLESPLAACGRARIEAALARDAQLREFEARDGIEASFDGPDDPRRAQLRRLEELLEEYDLVFDRPHHDVLARANAARAGVVEILSEWAPSDPRLARLRDYDPENPEALAEGPFGPIRQMKALLVWAVGGIRDDLMPPRQGYSDEARVLRAYVTALRDNPEEALRIEAAGVPSLPQEPDSYRSPPRGSIADACGPTSGDTSEGEATEEERYVDIGPYSCSAALDGPTLLEHARGEDQADHNSYEVDEGLPEGALSRFLYGEACNAGALEACGIHGWILAEGPEAERDPERAAELLRSSCEAPMAANGSIGSRLRACGRLGSHLRRGWSGHPADPEAAFRYLSRACSAFSPGFCPDRIDMIRTGELARTEAEQRDAYDAACRTGYVRLACALAAEMMLRGRGGPRDVDGAWERFERSVNGELGAELYWLGARMGIHRPTPERWASHMSYAACGDDDGNALACAWAAHLSAPSAGVGTRDLVRRNAAAACEAGAPDGCAVVGELGPPEEANASFEASCDAGGSLGCFLLAERLARRSPRRARGLYERACADDDEIALGCVELAIMLERGRGGPRNRERAAALRQRACDLVGHPAACPAPVVAAP